jgi:hypothetical protein
MLNNYSKKRVALDGNPEPNTILTFSRFVHAVQARISPHTPADVQHETHKTLSKMFGGLRKYGNARNQCPITEPAKCRAMALTGPSSFALISCSGISVLDEPGCLKSQLTLLKLFRVPSVQCKMSVSEQRGLSASTARNCILAGS